MRGRELHGEGARCRCLVEGAGFGVRGFGFGVWGLGFGCGVYVLFADGGGDVWDEGRARVQHRVHNVLPHPRMLTDLYQKPNASTYK